MCIFCCTFEGHRHYLETRQCHLESTFASCSPYYRHSHVFLKKTACRFIEPLPVGSFVSKLPPSIQIIAQLIDKSIFFQKKSARLLAYVHFLLYLCSRFHKRINLTACDLYKRMLKTCSTRPKQSLVDFLWRLVAQNGYAC